MNCVSKPALSSVLSGNTYNTVLKFAKLNTPARVKSAHRIFLSFLILLTGVMMQITLGHAPA